MIENTIPNILQHIGFLGHVLHDNLQKVDAIVKDRIFMENNPSFAHAYEEIKKNSFHVSVVSLTILKLHDKADETIDEDSKHSILNNTMLVIAECTIAIFTYDQWQTKQREYNAERN